jgi:hypothetical protein
MAWQGMARPGKAGQGKERFVAGHGGARPGMARHGKAWPGRAWRGMER